MWFPITIAGSSYLGFCWPHESGCIFHFMFGKFSTILSPIYFFSLSLLIWDFHNSLLFLLIMSQSVLSLFNNFFSFHYYDRIISNDLPFSSLILSSACLSLLLKYFIIFFHTVFYFSALVFILLIFFVELLILFMHFPPEFHVVVCPCFLHFTKLL